jgi:hypothetical protein
VAGLPEFLREREQTWRLSLRVMKQQYLRHLPSFAGHVALNDHPKEAPAEASH